MTDYIEIPHIRTELPGPRSKELLALARRYEPPVFNQQVPIVWASGTGAQVTDVDGNVFIDMTSGVLVTNIGHSHSEHVKAIQDQAGLLLNCYDFTTEWRAKLVEKLIEITPPTFERVILMTTGAEAIETAVKIARRYTGRTEIIAFDDGFHGRTYGSLSVGGKSSLRKGFGPTLPGVHHAHFPFCGRCSMADIPERCPYHTTEELDRIVRTSLSGEVAALIIEPYLGAGGSLFPPPGWLAMVSEWCKKRDIVFILDEVQSSFGRTGTLFAFEQEGFIPDLLCVGKGLGSGIPISAVLGPAGIMDQLDAGSFSTTSGGNPLACRAALNSIDIVLKENLAGRAVQLGKMMADRLKGLASRYAIVDEARGRGLVWGLEVVTDSETHQPAPEIAKGIIYSAFYKGVLIIAPIGPYGNVIRLAPPLVISEHLLLRAMDLIEAAVRELSI